MNLYTLKVGSSLEYHFWSTPCTTKATDAVKLFGPHLRRRKTIQVSNLAGRLGMHSMFQSCNNLRLRELAVVTSTADKIYVHTYVHLHMYIYLSTYMLHTCSISPSNQSDLQVTQEQLTATDAEKNIIQTELDRVKVCM